MRRPSSTSTSTSTSTQGADTLVIKKGPTSAATKKHNSNSNTTKNLKTTTKIVTIRSVASPNKPPVTKSAKKPDVGLSKSKTATTLKTNGAKTKTERYNEGTFRSSSTRREQYIPHTSSVITVTKNNGKTSVSEKMSNPPPKTKPATTTYKMLTLSSPATTSTTSTTKSTKKRSSPKSRTIQQAPSSNMAFLNAFSALTTTGSKTSNTHAGQLSMSKYRKQRGGNETDSGACSTTCVAFGGIIDAPVISSMQNGTVYGVNMSSTTPGELPTPVTDTGKYTVFPSDTNGGHNHSFQLPNTRF